MSSDTMISIQENYSKKVIPYFVKELGYKNKLAVPKIEKVSVNIGIGSLIKADTNASSTIQAIKEDLAMITGQKPVETKSKKSIAGFGTREGQAVGLRVTLRGARLIDFLNRLVNFALPRTRDFSGIPLASFDGKGNVTLGVKEQRVFPEVGRQEARQKGGKIFGFEITITSTAHSREEGIELLTQLGFPLER